MANGGNVPKSARRNWFDASLYVLAVVAAMAAIALIGHILNGHTFGHIFK
jgi:hypothetical protein